MQASLDTNAILHLYKANLQNILFNRFEKLKVYEFIRKQEMQTHADADVIAAFEKDVELGKIELITDTYLAEINMLDIFRAHVKDIRILFDVGDLGEVYAIALAKTLGCISLVTDDIKERGPHYTLMRIPDSDVIPFAFYEILFMDYMDQRIVEQELLDGFNLICKLSELEMDCIKKLKLFMKRFWQDPYSESEKKWMKSFCIEHGIDAKEKLYRLIRFLQQ